MTRLTNERNVFRCQFAFLTNHPVSSKELRHFFGNFKLFMSEELLFQRKNIEILSEE